MSALLARLTPGELFRLACDISRAEGYASGVYVESGDTAQRDLYAELLGVRLAAEDAYRTVTAGAQAQAHASRASALMGRALALAAAPRPASPRDDTGGGEDR